MSNMIPMIPSHSTSSVLMGGYACADAAVFAGRTRVTATTEQLPGTQVWSPPT